MPYTLHKFKVISLSFRTSIVVHVKTNLEDTDICYPKIKWNLGVPKLEIWDSRRPLADRCSVILDVMKTEKHPEIFQSY